MSLMEFEEEEYRYEEEEGNRPPASWPRPMVKKRLTKQMSMKDTTRENAWLKRKRQVLRMRKEMEAEEEAEEQDGEGGGINRERRERRKSLTDEDLDELKGFMDLGFRFKEEDGCHDLCNTLPALNLYFAVNRQLSDSKLQYSPSPISTPTTTSSHGSSPSLLGSPTPRSPDQHIGMESWKIVEPGDNPQHVKTKLRHWAQAVACSIRYLPTSGMFLFFRKTITAV